MSSRDPERPSRELADLHHVRSQVNELLERALQGVDSDTDIAAVWTPATDLFIEGDQIRCSVELPGVEDQAVHVAVRPRTIEVSGSRAPFVEGGSYLRMETRNGPFLRRIELPVTVNPDTLRRSWRHGVLHLELMREE